MIDTLPKLENLTPLVAIVLLFVVALIYMLRTFGEESKRNAEVHKQKTQAFLEDSVRKDGMITELTHMAFEAMERNTQAFITNTEMTKKVMESIDRLRSEMFSKK